MYVPSYWDYDQLFKNIDVCIIGSGIVGLNAALSLKSASPALQITVVDSGFLPYGASTRNAGFACFGSMTE
ncbi:MAG: FAD-binding oxidoreductase, partial [Bacteroidia bacterium]|nr:FAD-binding oxidoreductase [Bacteroidia bacterium]